MSKQDTEAREPDHNALIAQGIARRYESEIGLDGVYALRNQIEMELDKAREEGRTLHESSRKLTERIRNLLPALGMGIQPRRESLERLEAAVEDVEAAWNNLKRDEIDGKEG